MNQLPSLSLPSRLPSLRLFRDKYVVTMALVSLLGLVLAVVPLAASMNRLPDEVALWYTLPTSLRLAPAQYLWLIPAIAAISLAINTILGHVLYRRYPATTRLLLSLAAAGCLLAAAAIIQTILIYTTLL